MAESDNGNNNGGSVAGRTGVALWNSGILLTRLIDALALLEGTTDTTTDTSTTSTSSTITKSKNISTSSKNANSKNTNSATTTKDTFFRDKTILELGCGTALASIAASKLGAGYVIATDGNKEVLGLARRNLERNGIFPHGGDTTDTITTTTSSSNSSNSSGGGNGVVAGLQWGLMDASDYYDTADLIIGSDLTYNSGNWRVLVETLGSVLAPDGIVIYLTLGHSGFNVEGEINGFLTVVESVGELEVVKEGSAQWPFQNIKSLTRLLGDSLGSQEKEVVAGTGGYKVLMLRRRSKNSSKKSR